MSKLKTSLKLFTLIVAIVIVFSFLIPHFIKLDSNSSSDRQFKSFEERDLREIIIIKNIISLKIKDNFNLVLLSQLYTFPLLLIASSGPLIPLISEFNSFDERLDAFCKKYDYNQFKNLKYYYNNQIFISIIILIVSSCLSSIVSGYFALGSTDFSKFLIIGLFNFMTIIGVGFCFKNEFYDDSKSSILFMIYYSLLILILTLPIISVIFFLVILSEGLFFILFPIIIFLIFSKICSFDRKLGLFLLMFTILFDVFVFLSFNFLSNILVI